MADDTAKRAADGDVAAFTELVAQYQEMAFGYALTILRDFHLAQDATQEAFVAAYLGLHTLDDPARFPHWLRGIVRHHCWRLLRRRQIATVALDTAQTLSTQEPTPEQQIVAQEGLTQILTTLDALPERLRPPATLFYLGEYAQREIAALLGLPVTTVNNRLYAARQYLKERRTLMKSEHRTSADLAAMGGVVIHTEGSLIEARFAPEALPTALTALTPTEQINGDELSVSVIQLLPKGLIRGLVQSASGNAKELRIGAGLSNTATPIGRPASSDAVRQVIAAVHPESKAGAFIETGIKAVDLLAPFSTTGAVGLFGDLGVGKAVLLAEIIHNLGKRPAGFTIFAFIQAGEEAAFMHSMGEQLIPPAAEQRLCYLVVDQQEILVSDSASSRMSTTVYLSSEQAKNGFYPALDPARTHAQLLDTQLLGTEHRRVANEVRALLMQYPEDIESAQDLAPRARKLRRFLTQPFFTAEAFTQRPGQYVSREETVAGCAALLRGDHDDLPDSAFAWIGRIEQAREKVFTTQEP